MNKLYSRSLFGITTQDELKNYILKNGCYDYKENLRIYEKWFARAPRYYFRAVDRKYAITKKILCDAGCSYGMNLLFCKAGSYGIEKQKYQTDFAKSIGLTVYQNDLLEDDISYLPKAEAVWCSALLEHVNSPHIVLKNLYGLLRVKGLVAIYVPTIPIFSAVRYPPFLNRYTSGYLHKEHINAFTSETLRFICERAGFKTLEVSAFYPFYIGFANYLSVLKKVISGCVYIGIKDKK